jgi:hypothetical protein
MSANDTFGRSLAAWLQDDAANRVPDHLTEVLVRTAATRQRAWWSSPERWLPMDLTARASSLAPPRLGRALLIVVLMLALVGLAIVAVGSRQQRLPAPFGPAVTGLIAQEASGDIYAIDPVTRRRTIIVGGPEHDDAPYFSLDGTKLAFFRQVSATEHVVMVALPDGSDARRVSSPLKRWSGFEWTPDLAWSGDGSLIAVAGLRASPGPNQPTDVITIVNVHDGTSRVLDIGMAATEVSWLPPLGQELVFRGTPSGRPEAIFAARPDGAGLRLLTPQDGIPGEGYQSPVVSPDGRLLAYSTWEGNVVGLHVRDLADGPTAAIPSTERLGDLWPVVFSPDGRSLLMYQQSRDGPPPVFGGDIQLVLAPADGTATGRPLGPMIEFTDQGRVHWLKGGFSPDGNEVLALQSTDDAPGQVLWTLPVDGMPGTSEPASAAHLPTLQRIAEVPGPIVTACPGGGCGP